MEEERALNGRAPDRKRVQPRRSLVLSVWMHSVVDLPWPSHASTCFTSAASKTGSSYSLIAPIVANSPSWQMNIPNFLRLEKLE